jgi:zinc transport system substrate-binding protein
MISRAFLIVLFLLTAMSSNTLAESKLIVYTTNYPLTYFAERIGGEHINVIFPAPSDIDPVFWTPDAATVKEYQKADLIILNGAGYEKWAKKVSLPMLRTVDTSKALKDSLVHIDTNVTHSHGPGGDHSHGGTAFTTWLDFSHAAIQAEAIYKALVRRLTSQKDYFATNLAALKNELLVLDEQMMKIGERLNRTPLLASHPIYQYLARHYNLNVEMMMWEPDEYPDSAEWNNFQKVLKDHPAKWMIWEGEPLKESSQRLKELGIESLVFAPCMNKPPKGDFLTVMQTNIDNLPITLQ